MQKRNNYAKRKGNYKTEKYKAQKLKTHKMSSTEEWKWEATISEHEDRTIEFTQFEQ